MTPTAAIALDAHAAIDALIADAPAAAAEAAAPSSGSTRRATSAEVQKHLALVHRVIARFMRKLPANVDRGDLLSAGMYGLMTSLEKNGGDEGERFEGYAMLRIRGAILDELRQQDWLSRRARWAANGNGNGNGEAYTGPTAVVGLEDVGVGERAAHLVDRETPDALAGLEALGTRQELQAAIAQLPERERMIVAQHYFEGVSFKAISQQLQVSEPRVSQLHTRAIARLREHLAQAA